MLEEPPYFARMSGEEITRGRRRGRQPGEPGALGAMLAAEEGAILLEPVADNADAALRAGRRGLSGSTAP
jgi:hypothetical protein